MTDKLFDVCGIGNAIVDVLSHCELDFIDRMNLNKGTMTLIDAARAEELYNAMGPAVEVSGGSCGNTIAGLASLGGKGKPTPAEAAELDATWGIVAKKSA